MNSDNHAGFRRVWIGSTISATGDAASWIAMVALVLGSPHGSVAELAVCYTAPVAVGGLVDFLTYAPDTDPCSFGGVSYLYAVGYTTGVAPSTVAIRSSKATDSTNNADKPDEVTVHNRILLGPGAPPTGEAIIIPTPRDDEPARLKKKIQIATGVIVEAENSPVNSVVSKIVHWLKK